jgi:cyclopropane fatty-acyl-phospholipid synthase-like methyltransferase
MAREHRVLAAKGGFLTEIFREQGFKGCAKKVVAAIKMNLPVLAMGRRTNRSVGAYFDLITDDARMFYGDSFHFGYFKDPSESFEQGLFNHTDLVADMAQLGGAARVLDIGCGICAPAIRIAGKHDCHITGINISAEQVKQAAKLVASQNLSERIVVRRANALELPFEGDSFDSLLCLEVAGDICVSEEQKERLIDECWRVLKPGGHIGFSDLVFTGAPSCDEERSMQRVLYHRGADLITDWPGLFKRRGFEVHREMNIIEETMPTWTHSLAVYQSRRDEVVRRYGRSIAESTMGHLRQIPEILSRLGSFVVLSLEKPATAVTA